MKRSLNLTILSKNSSWGLEVLRDQTIMFFTDIEVVAIFHIFIKSKEAKFHLLHLLSRLNLQHL